MAVRGETRCCLFTIALGLLCAPAYATPTARFDDAEPATPRQTTKSQPAAQPAPKGPARQAVPTRASRRAPSSSESSWTRSARLYTAEADRLDRQGEPARALSAYHRAIDMDRSFGPAYVGLGRLRERMGDFPEAELVFTRATRTRSGRAAGLYHRALLRQRTGRQREAEQDLQAAIDTRPSETGWMRTLAGWYVASSAWSASLTVWRRLLVLAERRGDKTALHEAQIKVKALSWLAAETDPVRVAPPGRKHWVRSTFERIARRGGG